MVCNAGPLVQPLNRKSNQGGAPRLYQLFSHSDQVAQWQTSIADRIASTGWGGRTAGSRPPVRVPDGHRVVRRPVRLELVILTPNPGLGNVAQRPPFDLRWGAHEELPAHPAALGRHRREVCRPGGVRVVIAENLLLKQQLIVLHRARRRAPYLSQSDRLLCGFGALLSLGRHSKGRYRLRPFTDPGIASLPVALRASAGCFWSTSQTRGSPARKRARPGTHPSHRRIPVAQCLRLHLHPPHRRPRLVLMVNTAALLITYPPLPRQLLSMERFATEVSHETDCDWTENRRHASSSRFKFPVLFSRQRSK